ncbi:MAG: N-acetyl-alpha-D-glucosaminyl L-malate synthase BshA [Bacillota bacterium]|nr:MAG: N-acetyl-alpha-D-glucosaminyl L-malate synthase BshA [Bacillota bacterium]
MRIAIVCYPSVGGSGIVATELAVQLARRGHEVHVVSSALPFRLSRFEERIRFHQVETPTYPLFQEPPYVLALTNKLVEVHRVAGLDVIHAHYAVPHATAAYLAREVIGPGGPRVVTTLHGTDITLMGADPSFTEIIAFSINRSDAVTAVSESLRADTVALLPVDRPVRVIPNFLDCERWRRQDAADLRRRLAPAGERLLLHMSNFRRVKRPWDVVEIFARVARRMPARLLLVGEGPELAPTLSLAERLGVRERLLVLGTQEEVVPLLSAADLFLLPSEQESFGLAALEAMACGVPVVASRTGGLPEVVVDGETGFLCQVGDVEAMARRALQILEDGELHRRLGGAAVERVRTLFCAERIVPQYEALYREVVG